MRWVARAWLSVALTALVSAAACRPLFIPEAPDARCAPVPAGIVSWWPGDGSPVDIEGLNDGMPEGPVAYAPGMVGQAFSFDGNDDVVTTTNSFPVLAQDRTIELWLELTSEGDAGYNLDFTLYGTAGEAEADTDIGAFQPGGNPANGPPYLIAGQAGAYLQGPSLALNTWYHVALTVRDQTFQLYLNGEVVASEVLPLRTPAGTLFFIAGPGATPRTGAWYHFIGLADEISVYSRALSGAEIKSIFVAGPRGKCRD